MEEVKEEIKDAVQTEHGIRIDGMGVLMANSKKQVELLDKIQKFLFFMEKRQKEMFEWMQNSKV